VQVSKQLGADLLTLTGTRESRLRLGESFRTDLVLNVRDGDTVSRVRAATGGHGTDIVLECSGAPSAVDDSLAMAERGGRVVLVDSFEEPGHLRRQPSRHERHHPSTPSGARGAGSVARAVSLASQGRIDTESLVTHHFPPDAVSEAFDTYAERRGDALSTPSRAADGLAVSQESESNLWLVEALGYRVCPAFDTNVLHTCHK
jgi:threonine dehydrogenase-like Zn-dependent dehydrogenase